MGFRKSTSFKVMPGVRVRVSTHGVGTYVGGRKISPRKVPASPRTGTARTSTTAPAQAPVRPGMFAPKEEKALFAFLSQPDALNLEETVLAHPQYALLGNALLGLRHLIHGQTDRAVEYLRAALSLDGEVESHAFTRKYLSSYRLTLGIAGGVSVELPLSHDAVTLALAEGLQIQGQTRTAVYYVEALDPSYPALLSLADLYVELEDWHEVLRLTNGFGVDSEITAMLAIFRAKSHLALGELVAAKECIKPLTASKKYGTGLRFQALALRSEISLTEGAFARATADLEKILAEDSSLPGLREALARIQRRQQEIEQDKSDAIRQKARAAEQKREEAERAKEEKRAEAERVRAEKAAARDRLAAERAAPKPALQAAVIDLSFDEDADISDEPELAQPEAGGLVPGFYPDPQEVAPFRYWDGSAWTSRIRMKP
ncbi:DUF2510 domain-containing protein [Arthrobacter sp. AL08]|uniref:DUF2510 domain-containing protein n=1 Tax=unclassified Arthrobacter TaxID=235627 RepID=UPI00249B9EB3|nr:MULTISPECIES: DUF2510 domain-containing protein [unclassified Arthrobacter]MDI3242221.1 DUF2510 domain-containing protein [Arthrobacter sp. AL05]MDI3278173.1 DUF2510 domain-containing protein [Arthrobacter sp. AL08]